jgi:hypothetical protein
MKRREMYIFRWPSNIRKRTISQHVMSNANVYLIDRSKINLVYVKKGRCNQIIKAENLTKVRLLYYWLLTLHCILIVEEYKSKL